MRTEKVRTRTEKMRTEKMRTEKIRTEKMRTKKIRTKKIRTDVINIIIALRVFEPQRSFLLWVFNHSVGFCVYVISVISRKMFVYPRNHKLCSVRRVGSKGENKCYRLWHKKVKWNVNKVSRKHTKQHSREKEKTQNKWNYCIFMKYSGSIDNGRLLSTRTWYTKRSEYLNNN